MPEGPKTEPRENSIVDCFDTHEWELSNVEQTKADIEVGIKKAEELILNHEEVSKWIEKYWVKLNAPNTDVSTYIHGANTTHKDILIYAAVVSKSSMSSDMFYTFGDLTWFDHQDPAWYTKMQEAQSEFENIMSSNQDLSSYIDSYNTLSGRSSEQERITGLSAAQLATCLEN